MKDKMRTRTILTGIVLVAAAALNDEFTRLLLSLVSQTSSAAWPGDAAFAGRPPCWFLGNHATSRATT
jgi:hypothetical protein